MNILSRFISKLSINWIKSHNSAKKELIKDMGYNIANLNEIDLSSISNSMPDMLWAKDINGKYLFANDKIIKELLFSSDLESTIGKTDYELATARRKIIGDENHTFGVVCGDSDSLVLKTGKPQRFLEFGLVTGKEMYLEVHKDVLRNSDGDIIGSVGTGRNITNEYLALKNIISNNDCPEDISEEISKILNKYYFEEL